MDCPIGEICKHWTDDRDVVRCIQQHGGAKDPCFGHELLATQYRKQLFEHAYQRLGNWEDAEDCVQEAIVNALRAIDSFRCECAVSTWLWRIVARVCFDHLRTRQGQRFEPVLTDLHTQDDCSGCPICDAPGLGATEFNELVLAFNERDAVREALRDLPESLSAILKEHYLGGEPWKDMAMRMNIDPKTLRVRRMRAERLLRAMLERKGWLPNAEFVASR